MKNKQVKQMLRDIEQTEYLPSIDGNSGYDLSNITGVALVKANELPKCRSLYASTALMQGTDNV